MATQAHKIKRAPGSRRKPKRVGRGNSSQKGMTAGRGMKGQKARSGGKSRLAIRGFKQSLQKVPKVRGFKSIHAKPDVVTLSTLEKVAKEGDVVSPGYLKSKKVITRYSNGVKIVATGELKKKITVRDCKLSKTAAEAITKAGGTVA